MFTSNAILLFQGDSITDCGRDRENTAANRAQSLGCGYVNMVGVALLAQHPELNLSCLNRGFSGNIVQQLEARWQEDALDLKPDVLSILVGINDAARGAMGSGHAPQAYDACYRGILDASRKQNPNLKIVVGEPFFILVKEEQRCWIEGLEARRAMARRIADNYNAVWVPYQSMFDEALKQAPVSYWLPDGVHPTLAAHCRMAQLWLKCVRQAWG